MSPFPAFPQEPMSSKTPSYLASTRSHWALSCFDILCSIFAHLALLEETWCHFDPSTDDARSSYKCGEKTVSRATLARCARVCKAFFTPAISVLWRDIDSISLLVAAMRALECPSRSKLTHRLKPDTRASEYARHILTVHGYGGPLSPPEQAFLAHAFAGETKQIPLLPHLKHLRWIQLVPSSTEILQIIPSSLQSLHIIFRKSPEWSSDAASSDIYEAFVRDLLENIVTKAPLLQYLRVSTAGNISDPWLEPIGRLSRLNTVDLGGRIYAKPATGPLIPALAPMPALRHLKFRLPAALPPDILSHAFPALQTLTLDAMFAALSTVTVFLSTITSRQLTSLVLQNCECTSSSVDTELHALCDVMRTRFTPALHKLELSLRGGGRGVTNIHTRPLIQTIEPLLDMYAMEDISLSIAPEVEALPASEHDLEKMADAWPGATRVHLSYPSGAALPSLEDITAVARRCRGLRDLVLPGVDASHGAPGANAKPKLESGWPGWPDAAMTESERTHARTRALDPHGLRSLGLADDGWKSCIPDPARLARFLDGLFPGVEWRCPPLASEEWRETVEEVVRLRIARMLC